jgi:3-hydroxypropanoate dehydrogenase
VQKMLNDQGLDLLYRNARSQNAWTAEPVSETLIRAVYDLTKMGPTSANCSPARFIILASNTAKERIRPYISPNNVQKTMTAPVCVIFGYDLAFFEKLPALFPHNPAVKDWFASNPALAEQTAFRNGTLQAAYFMLAARALGLDCGPMSGFENAGVDREFFAGTTIKSNFICSIGHGDPKGLFPRSPRLSFEEACRIL